MRRRGSKPREGAYTHPQEALHLRGRALEGLTIGGESPVPEGGSRLAAELEYHGAR